MSATVPLLLMPLRRAVVAFFRHDIAWRRGDAGMRLVLEDRLCPADERPLTRAEQAARKDERELDVARLQLGQALDEEPLLRSQMRHLAFIEHALERKGWRALYKVPVGALQQALQQLEGHVTNWSPEGLACLRSKMAVAVIERDNEHGDDGAGTAAGAGPTSLMLQSAPVLAASAIRTARIASDGEAGDRDDDDDAAALMAAYAAITGMPQPAAAVAAATATADAAAATGDADRLLTQRG